MKYFIVLLVTMLLTAAAAAQQPTKSPPDVYAYVDDKGEVVLDAKQSVTTAVILPHPADRCATPVTFRYPSRTQVILVCVDKGVENFKVIPEDVWLAWEAAHRVKSGATESDSSAYGQAVARQHGICGDRPALNSGGGRP